MQVSAPNCDPGQTPSQINIDEPARECRPPPRVWGSDRFRLEGYRVGVKRRLVFRCGFTDAVRAFVLRTFFQHWSLRNKVIQFEVGCPHQLGLGLSTLPLLFVA